MRRYYSRQRSATPRESILSPKEERDSQLGGGGGGAVVGPESVGKIERRMKRWKVTDAR